MNLNNLFPTPVAFFNYDQDITKKEMEFFVNQVKVPNMGNTTSENRKILHDKKVKDIASFVQTSIDKYFDEVYRPKNDVKPYITQSWMNYTEKNQYHHKHAHPNSFISGVFYVNADPEKDKIFFFKDEYQRLKIEARDFNSWNSESWWFNIQRGLLVIFPSHLTHMVETVTAEDTRISLSFNTFLKGYLGSDETLTGLHL